MKPETIKIDDELYVRQDSAQAKTFEGMRYVIVRSDRAGVFAGYLESKEGGEVVLRQSRRLWRWLWLWLMKGKED